MPSIYPRGHGRIPSPFGSRLWSRRIGTWLRGALVLALLAGALAASPLACRSQGEADGAGGQSGDEGSRPRLTPLGEAELGQRAR